MEFPQELKEISPRLDMTPRRSIPSLLQRHPSPPSQSLKEKTWYTQEDYYFELAQDNRPEKHPKDLRRRFAPIEYRETEPYLIPPKYEWTQIGFKPSKEMDTDEKIKEEVCRECLKPPHQGYCRDEPTLEQKERHKKEVEAAKATITCPDCGKSIFEH